jgi:hypothetical protein
LIDYSLHTTNMSERDTKLEEYDKDTHKWYIAQYLQHGSVEEVYKAHRFDILIPPASYHRLIKNAGIVKASGRREVSLSEVLHFFAQKALEPTLGIETLYRHMPPSFRTSLATLHRTYNNVLDNNPSRVATALIIHPQGDPEHVLTGEELFTHRRAVKYRGEISIPMCFSQPHEPAKQSILRVLQQEVFAQKAVQGELRPDSELTNELISPNTAPFMYLDILDVRVSVYKIAIDNRLCEFASYKLGNIMFRNLDALEDSQESLRSGIGDILHEYNASLYIQHTAPSYKFSNLNLALVSTSQ